MNNLKFHHIGVATKNLEKELASFSMLGYIPMSDIFVDNIQKIRGLFIASSDQPCLELLENLDDSGPLTNILSQGIKFYHFAYETENIEKSLADLVQSGAVIITPITDATYFKKICFVMMRNKMIVELVQLK